jgi:hypothetical protein
MKKPTRRKLVLRQETVRTLKLPLLIEIRGGVVVDTDDPKTSCPVVAIAVAATIPGAK